MIEQLKELEQEAMDNVCPDRHEIITQNFMHEEDMELYQCGYIDGLRTAIRLLSENDSSMSYSVNMEDIFDDEERDED